jgi:hypothetical protein
MREVVTALNLEKGIIALRQLVANNGLDRVQPGTWDDKADVV